MRDLIRLMGVMIDLYCASYTKPPDAVTLDIDDTLDIEIRGHLRRLVRRIRRHWPQIRITIRGDGHYGRPEVMEWCDENEVDRVTNRMG